MKYTRILSLMLLALMAFMLLTGCGKDPVDPTKPLEPAATVAYVQEVLHRSSPTKAATDASYQLVKYPETVLRGKATLQIQDATPSARFSYEIEKLADDLSVVTDKGVRYSSSGRVVEFDDDGTYAFQIYRTETALSMTLPGNASVEAKDGGYLLSATVSAADAKSVFGVDFGATGNVSFTLFVRDSLLSSMTVSYSTANVNVQINTAFTYGKESFRVETER